MKKNAIIVGIAMLIPYLITLLFINRQADHNKKYEIAESGKLVIMEQGEMDVEKFIPLVLMGRMDLDEEEELLKVQAVIIRTYIAKKMEKSGENSIKIEDLNLKYVSYDKLKKMWGDEFAEKYNYLNKIIHNTSMKIILYEGKVITPYYHKASSGMTRKGTQKYLKSVESKEDTGAKNFLTIKYYSLEEVKNILHGDDAEIILEEENIEENFQIETQENSEYVEKISIGKKEYTGDEFAKLFDLPSSAFVIENYEDQVRIIAKGEGHGYGVSMYGAAAMAKEGASYQDILEYYYSQVTIEPYP